MENLTCKTPSPSTRAEAWAAWEAAVLALTGRSTPVERPHLKKFWSRFDRKSWVFFAMEVWPNRNEVTVLNLDGRVVKANVIVGPGVGARPLVTQYRVNREKYPDLAERQDRMIALGAVTARQLTRVDEPLVRRVSYEEYGRYYTYSTKYRSRPVLRELLGDGSIVSYELDPKAVYWVPAEPEGLKDTARLHCRDKDFLIRKLKDGL